MSTQLETSTVTPEPAAAELSYREAICAALSDEMAADATVLLMGEDVAEAGGVFKTSEGLVDRFGRERVRNTPICENGFVGVALGMAVTGLRPVVEIMFSDFLQPAADAIVNEAPEFRYMSGGQPVRGADDPLDWRRHRAVRDAALGDRRVLVPAAARSLRLHGRHPRCGLRGPARRDPEPQPRPLSRAQGALRPEGPGSRRERAEFGKAEVAREGSV